MKFFLLQVLLVFLVKQTKGQSGECSHGDMILSDGSSYTEGRVEVCFNGSWGTVCDDQWSYQDAQVVCKQLGYPYTEAMALSGAYYGPGNGLIHMANVKCTGDEENLFDCTFIQNHTCQHFKDASVNCTVAECIEGVVNLVGGMNETEGRVEICLGGNWYRVCDSYFSWTYKDAQVVCKQLGYPYSGARVISSTFSGGGKVMDGNGLRLSCTGNEEHLLNCTCAPDHNCWHDASVNCTVAECTEGAVRLVGGMSETEGRVEICLGGNWYRMCDSDSLYKEARVVCKQLGYPFSGARPISSTYSGGGNGLTYIDELQCTGNEEHLLNCTYELYHNCWHGDVNVNCTVADCNEGTVRLVGGKNKTEGQVEICLYGSWGIVCDNLWTDREAKLVCKQLGFPYTEAKAFSDKYSNYGWNEELIHLIAVDCTGNEDILINCDYIQDGYCDYTVEVQCDGGVCIDHDVRIAGGLNATEGRVEVCLSGVWGTVCGSRWDEIGARVVCRQLGHEWSGAKSYTRAYHGQRSGPALLIYLGCNGNEESIFNCMLDQNRSSCTNEEVAGVVCTQSHTFSSQQTNATEAPSILSTPAYSVIHTTGHAFSSQTNATKAPSITVSFPTSAIIGASIALIVIVLVILTIILIFVSSISYKRSKIKRVQRSNSVPVSNISTLIRNEYVTNIVLQNFERKASVILQSCIIRKSNLRVLEKIGQGEFGIVYRGVLEEHNAEETKIHAVAIKTLKGYFNESHIDEIFEEATKMKSFDHKNVLSLNGVCLDLMETPCIVMPFMDGGSLLSYLRKESTNLLISEVADEELICDTTKQLLSMCLQVAKGMTYLAQRKFVHRDLAARNCMISSMGIIKVADFGLSESLYTKDYFKQSSDSDSHVKLPIKWMALESIHYGKFSEKTDVWSFGVLCWETFSLGKMPYPGLDPQAIVKMLDTGERMSKPLNAACTDKCYSLMMSCWNENADERPHFSEIEQTLEQAIAPLADYMEFTDIFNIKNESID